MLYAVSAVYFAGVMVRLMLTLTPVVCVLSGIAFSHLLGLYLKEEESQSSQDSDSETDDGSNEKSSRNLYDKVRSHGNTFYLKITCKASCEQSQLLHR